MKKLLLISLALLALVGCGQKAVEESPAEEKVTIANPFYNYDTLEEAIAGATVSMNIPATVGEYDNITEYRAIPGELLEIIYLDEQGNMLKIRKAHGQDDVSGYYGYEVFEESEIDLDGVTLHVYTQDGLVYVATWLSASETFGVTADKGISEADFLELAKKMLIDAK